MANDSKLRNQEEQIASKTEDRNVEDRVPQEHEEQEKQGAQDAQITLGNDILAYLQALLAQTSPLYIFPNQVESVNKPNLPAGVRGMDWLINMRQGLKYATAEGAEEMYRAIEYPDSATSSDRMVLRLNVTNELLGMLDYRYRLDAIDVELCEYYEEMFTVNGMSTKVESCVRIDDRVELPGDIISTQATEALRLATAQDISQLNELRAKIKHLATAIKEKCGEIFDDWLPFPTHKATTALYRTVCIGIAPGDYNKLMEIITQRRSLIERMGKKQWPGIKYSMEFEREFNQLYQEYQEIATQCHYLNHLDGMTQIAKGLISVIEQQEQKLIEQQETISEQQEQLDECKAEEES